MGFELSVDPPTCPIAAEGGVSKHKIVNHTDQMIAFKIRSSNNSNYSVNSTSGLIQIGYTHDLVITRIKGKPKADFLRVQYVLVPQSARNPLDYFPNSVPTGEVTGETFIKLSAAE